AWNIRKINLLIASYIFYSAWNPPFVILLWISTVVDWYAAQGLVRAQRPVAQFEQPRRASRQQLFFGLALMTIGMFNKVVLADGFLAHVAETVYDTDKIPGALDAWMGTLAFSGQIFCDFAGYSTIAIGVAMCLGFAMPDNFRFPYAAIGFSDFWRRWHITLSS